MAIRKPCKTCPWRIEADVADIPGFSLELAEGLDKTCDAQMGSPAMACHQSTADGQFVCAGWLARYGADSITIRLVLGGAIHEDNAPGAILKGITPESVFGDLPDDWPEMHETFEEMIVKMRAQMAGDE